MLTVKFHLTLVRMAKVHKTTTTNAREDTGKRDPAFAVGVVVDCCSYSGNEHGDP